MMGVEAVFAVEQAQIRLDNNKTKGANEKGTGS